MAVKHILFENGIRITIKWTGVSQNPHLSCVCAHKNFSEEKKKKNELRKHNSDEMREKKKCEREGAKENETN